MYCREYRILYILLQSLSLRKNFKSTEKQKRKPMREWYFSFGTSKHFTLHKKGIRSWEWKIRVKSTAFTLFSHKKKIKERNRWLIEIFKAHVSMLSATTSLACPTRAHNRSFSIYHMTVNDDPNGWDGFQSQDFHQILLANTHTQ